MQTSKERHEFSLLSALFGMIAEYVHSIYYDRYFGGASLKAKLFYKLIYKPICHFQNREWRYNWFQYAEYCRKRSQFYSKPLIPFISQSKGYGKFISKYVNEKGAIETWKILEERPF